MCIKQVVHLLLWQWQGWCFVWKHFSRQNRKRLADFRFRFLREMLDFMKYMVCIYVIVTVS